MYRYDKLRQLLYSITGSGPSSSTQRGSYPQYRLPSATHALPTPSGSSPLDTSISPQSFTPGTQTDPLVYLKDNYSYRLFEGRLLFKDSPFYSILEPLTPTVECKGKLDISHGCAGRIRLTKPSTRANEG